MIASVVIPAFNRIGPLQDTLRSAYCALERLSEPAEVVLVDDGSSTPLAQLDLPRPSSGQVELVTCRQANSGSVVARQTGLRLARGEFVQFLDSDDLIAPDKLAIQIAAMRESAAVMSIGTLVSAANSDQGNIEFDPAPPAAARTRPLVEWLLIEQPPPHLPVYRRNWLNTTLTREIVALDRRTDPAGDIWLYLNLCLGIGSAVHTPTARAAIGVHEEIRFSQQWERLAFASLMITEEFMAATRHLPEAETARRWIGVTALRSWRRLPKDFVREYQERLLDIWRQSPRAPLEVLDGARFAQLARFLGTERAAHWLRALRGHRYDSCRTLSPSELLELSRASRRR